jgi:hypothetical protein
VLKELARELKNLDDTPLKTLRCMLMRRTFPTSLLTLKDHVSLCPSLAISCLEMYKLDWEQQAHGGSEPISLMV